MKQERPEETAPYRVPLAAALAASVFLEKIVGETQIIRNQPSFEAESSSIEAQIEGLVLIATIQDTGGQGCRQWHTACWPLHTVFEGVSVIGNGGFTNPVGSLLSEELTDADVLRISAVPSDRSQCIVSVEFDFFPNV